MLVTLVTALAVVIGAIVTWARISDRTVSRAVEKAGRQSEKAAAAAVDRLYERLQSNDFRHVEAKIESVEAKAHADREAMESRIGERFDCMGARIERMEWRPGCWRQFSSGRKRMTPNPGLEPLSSPVGLGTGG